MKIAVIDYIHQDLNIHVCDKAYIDDNYEGSIERFLGEDQGYNLDNIAWTNDLRSVNIIDNDTINQIST